tara:strand:- start:22 stop:795 length:774 start_codon:yes stop_codon:yes gene_type:complete
MLGIGQISTRIAELIRGALPYAIVNNNPDASLFARLASYSEVQQAIDAGHTWIKVKPSDTDYVNFTVDNDYTKIESSWGARFTNTNTATNNHVIVVSGSYCTLTGLRTYTPGLESSNDRRGFNITGNHNYIINCIVEDSDASGFAVDGAYNTFQSCHVSDADDYGFYVNSSRVSIIGCRMQSSGSAPLYFTASADYCLTVGNACQDTNSVNVVTGAIDGVMVGNSINGGVSISQANAWILGSNTATAGDPPGANKLY